MDKETRIRIAKRFIEQSEGVHFEAPKHVGKVDYEYKIIELDSLEELLNSMGKTAKQVEEERENKKKKD